ncbi:MAG: CHAD domain-containing protein [Candidatus Binatia bacterium]
MDGENEPKPESTMGDAPRVATLVEAPDSIARRALRRLLRKRVKKFMASAPAARRNAETKTVHDARVWSRRLQQAVGALFPKPRSGKVRRLRRTPRRIRRALGEWRNCDVLLEMVAKQQRRTRSDAKRRAWALVRDYLLQKRSKEVARAEKKMLRVDLGDYTALAQRLLDQPPEESPEVLMERLRDSVRRAWSKWQNALSRAQETRAAADLHRFRIATKDLRYRRELLDGVGQRHVKAQLKWLAELQEALGVWHDRQVLDQAVAEAVARAEILRTELRSARILLAELETDQRRQSRDIEKIFRLAMEHPAHQETESWSVNPVAPSPHLRGEGSGVSSQ